MLLSQLPPPTQSELTSWILAGASVLSLAAVIKSFIRKPPLEAEFVTKQELTDLRHELRDLQTRTARIEGRLRK